MPNRRRPYQFNAGPRVQELLDQGKTHVAISIETGVSTRTIGRWLKDGWLRRPSHVSARVPPTDAAGHAPEQEWTARALLDLGTNPDVVARVLELVENMVTASNPQEGWPRPPTLVQAGVAPKDPPERAPQKEWTARDLLDMGMAPAAVERALRMVGGMVTARNPRWHEWLSRYFPLTVRIPDEWAATVALLPILGRDLSNPALEKLAELMHESLPWESERLRRRYDRLARTLLSDARSTTNDWLLFVSSTEMATALPVVEAGVVSEILLRCPHVDRSVRKRRPVHKEDRALGLQLLRNMPMGALAMAWSRLVDGEPSWLEAYANWTQRKARRQEKGKNIQ